MRLVEKYWGLPFTKEEVEEIGKMLDLQQHEQAISAAAYIAGALEFCQLQEHARKLVPEVKAARRRLDRIATTAQHLSKLLSDEPLAAKLSVEPGWSLQTDEYGVIDINKVFEHAANRIEIIKSNLLTISTNAARLADCDRELRAAYLLPRASEAVKSTPTIYLWPKLFEIWEHAGRRVAGTPDGPLHRFIKLIHEAAELLEPNASTLKDAVSEWKHDGPKARSASSPPWRTEGED